MPPVVNGATRPVAATSPATSTDLRDNKTIRDFDDKYDITSKLQEEAKKLPDKLGDAAGALQSIAAGVVNAAFQLLTILTMTFFLLLDGRRIANFLITRFGRHREERLRDVAERIYKSTVGLRRRRADDHLDQRDPHVHHPDDPRRAVRRAARGADVVLRPDPARRRDDRRRAHPHRHAVHGLPERDDHLRRSSSILYQQVENNVLQPFIFKRTVNVPPLAVIVAILAGSSVLGVVGALVAIPIAAALQIVLKEY